MWRMSPTVGWQNSAQMFMLQYEESVSILLRNIGHFRAQLAVAKHRNRIEALYLHRKASGVVAIDTQGLDINVEPLLAYVYPEEQKRVLHLLKVGKAIDEDTDMEYCKAVVISLVTQQKI